MVGKGFRAVDDQMRSSPEGLSRVGKRHCESARMREVLPVYVRTTSSSTMEVGASSTISLVEGEPRRRDQMRSKSGAWKEPMLLLQRMNSRRIFRQRQKPSKVSSTSYSPEYNSTNRPSHWVRFWRKLRFDGGKKVHAARADWLNYDAHSYAMNFEKEGESPSNTNSLPMPRLSGPGAREIVTVLLKRSSSANRNSGAILIPRPVYVTKHEMNTPLWKRRSVRAPSSLDLQVKTVSARRKSNAAGA